MKTSILFSRSQGSVLTVRMSASCWGCPGDVLPLLQYGGSWNVLGLSPSVGSSSSLTLVGTVSFLTGQVPRAQLHPVTVRKDTHDPLYLFLSVCSETVTRDVFKKCF